MKKIISIGLLLLVIGCTKKNLNECGTIVKMEVKMSPSGYYVPYAADRQKWKEVKSEERSYVTLDVSGMIQEVVVSPSVYNSLKVGDIYCK